jgi:hypothetical protein
MLLNVGAKYVAVHRTVDNQRRDQSTDTKARNECCRLPMTVWNPGYQALTSEGPTVTPCHLGIGAGLIEKYEPSGIEMGTPEQPTLSQFTNVLAILLSSMHYFF